MDSLEYERIKKVARQIVAISAEQKLTLKEFWGALEVARDISHEEQPKDGEQSQRRLVVRETA